MLDLFTWFAGLPAKVSAQTRIRLHDIEVEDEAFALLEYQNGAHGYLYATTNEAPGQDRIEIVGDKGKIVVHSGTATYWMLQPSIGRYTKESTEMWSAPEAIKTELELVDREEGHGAITRNFCRAILYGEPLLAPGEEGINAVEMIDSMILSGKSGRAVDVPVDRNKYEALLDDLRKSSKKKSNVREQRVTDPHLGV
jgi:predicted dehydrogenase